MTAKEKVKFEDLAKNDKVRYDGEMRTYVPPKGTKMGKKKKDPNAPKRPPWVNKHDLCDIAMLISSLIILFYAGLPSLSSALSTAKR